MFENKKTIEFVGLCQKLACDIVAVSVLGTEGSTYRKKGALMLVSSEGDFTGVVSGGCFENDIVNCAQGVLRQRTGKYVKHDLRMEDESFETWGKGVGCNGLIELWMEPFYHAEGYGALGEACRLAREGKEAILARSIKESGTYAVMAEGEIAHNPAMPDQSDLFAGYTPESDAHFDSENKVFFQRIDSPYRLLVLGAGPGCEPLVRMADTLGWYTRVCDTREDHMDHVVTCDEKTLMDCCEDADCICSEGFDASVIMSHSFVQDASYLRTLMRSEVNYIGIMGPKKRTRLIMDHLVQEGSPLDARVHNPVGLDLGGESPESIALSVCAEIEARRFGKQPTFLRDKHSAPVHA